MLSHVLLVGTSTTYTTLIRYRLDSMPSIDLREAATGNEALTVFDATTTLVVVDANLPDESALDLVMSMRAGWDNVPILLLVRPEEVAAARKALAYGVTDILVSGGSDLDRIEWWLTQARSHATTVSLPVGRFVSSSHTLVGESSAIRRARCLIEQAQRSDAPILLEAETGTEPERWAQTLHDRSSRADAPFITLDCALFAEDATIADVVFEDDEASDVPSESWKGTLFLDNVAMLSEKHQQALLNILHEGFTVVDGRDVRIPFDGRLICGTCHDLKALVDDGAFDPKLYSMLSASSVMLPPLRDRKEDLLLVAQQMLREMTDEAAEAPIAFSVPAMQHMLRYEWPGNQRELRGAIAQGMKTANGLEMTAVDLFPEELSEDRPPSDQRERLPGHLMSDPSDENSHQNADATAEGQKEPEGKAGPRSLFNMQSIRTTASRSDSSRAENGSNRRPTPLEMMAVRAPDAIVPLEELQVLAVQHALNLCGGDMNQAARALGVPASLVSHIANEVLDDGNISFRG